MEELKKRNRTDEKDEHVWGGSKQASNEITMRVISSGKCYTMVVQMSCNIDLIQQRRTGNKRVELLVVVILHQACRTQPDG